MSGLTALLIGSLIVASAPGSFAPEYAALGDSYAAGVGTPGSSGHCGRSPNAYPSLYAEQHNLFNTHLAACNGAGTADVVKDQLGDLTGATSFVSITVGGADAGFADVMSTCVRGGDSACTDKVHQAEQVVNGPLSDRLSSMFQEIHAKAPNANLVVLGYPHVVEDSGPCSLSTEKRKALNEGADQLAEVTRDGAARAGAVFLDARPAFAGHGYCAPDTWINGVTFPDTDGSFRPNAAGQRNGYLPLLNG